MPGKGRFNRFRLTWSVYYLDRPEIFVPTYQFLSRHFAFVVEPEDMKHLILSFWILLGGSLAEAYNAQIISQNVTTKTAKSVTEKIIIRDVNFGTEVMLHKRTSLTKDKAPQPTLFILSGLHAGDKSVHLLPEVDGVTVVSLDYNVPLHQSALQNAQELIGRLPQIQTQILTAYIWLAHQPEVDKNRLSVINISFGTFVGPSALRMLSSMGHTPYTTTFLFGGASLEAFFQPILNQEAINLLGPQVVQWISQGLKNLSPEQHLAYLKGPFLVVNGISDEVIPSQSAHALFEGLRHPKKSVWLPTGHINSERADVIQVTSDIVLKWLMEQKAL